MNNIIVNADDFGARSSVNRAIVELFDNSIINSATLMANMPGFEEAVELTHQHKIHDNIGVHLVLTAGVPLTPEIRSLPYLFDEENTSRGKLISKLFLLSKEQKTLIFREYVRQIERVKKQRIPITHLDTHQHMHDMWGVMQVLTELARVYNIPSIRILNNLNITGYFKYAYRKFVNWYLSSKKINYSDYFGSQVDLLSALEKKPGFIKNKIVEIMVHPDYNSRGQLIDLFPDRTYDFDFVKRLSYTAITSHG